MKSTLKKLAFLPFLAITLSLSSFTTIHPKANTSVNAKRLVDESISVGTGLISGSNDVSVNFDRTGTEAGLYEVHITYTVRFNEGSPSQSIQTFTKTMGPGELTATESVQGPNPTAWAEVIDASWTY